jgi:hypothetical protein
MTAMGSPSLVFWPPAMTSSPTNLPLPIPAKLRTFLALNGNRVKFTLVAGQVVRYECLTRRKKRNGQRIERLEHAIWMQLTDGREECLKLKRFEGKVQVGQWLVLALGSNRERVECVAVYNRSIDKIFYRQEVWGKLLETGCLLPLLFLLFVFPLLWLFLAMIFFRLDASLKAVLVAPLVALGASCLGYLAVTLPVRFLFLHHVKAVLRVSPPRDR